MKFERWDKDKKMFVKSDIGEEDYYELLIQFDYVEAEFEIEERIEMLKFKNNHSPEQFWSTEMIIYPKYD
tara:strand:+ start:538 stop:747 length:210 start_codon:yes stop_codon:yes gene_type:complete